MKYKLGDKVRIKSFDWYNQNKDEDGFVHCGDRVFDDYMSVFCGSVVTIRGIYHTGYDIQEDMQCRTWTDEMIEGLVDEEPQKKMVSLDDVCSVLYDMLHELDINDHIILGTCEYDNVVDFIKYFRKSLEE